MPDGLDPDEIVKRNREEWKEIIEAAQPIIEHVMQALAQGRDLRDRKVTAEISAQVLPLIQDLPKPEEREFYIQKLARFLRIDERAFLGEQARRGPSRPRRRAAPAKPTSPEVSLPASPALPARRRIEGHVLAWLVRRPELIYRVDRLLQQHGLATLATEDFAYTDDQLLFGLIRQAVEQDEMDHHAYVVKSLPESISGPAGELLAMTEDVDVQDDRLLEELLRGIRRMREEAASEKRTQYRFLQEEAEESGDQESASLYQGEVLKLTQLKRLLDDFEHQMSLKRMQ
jgi:DNA primase